MIEKTYQPSEIETRMSRLWEDAGAFKAGRPERRDAKPFTIVIPPPNVTGSLHMGHALNNTLQDVLCRFERMRGRDVLWQPGTDHAGIATQLVVERQLMERQQPGRREMGRAKFLERVWQWKAESGGVIVNQLKRLGASCDWSRERFTMDEGLSRAVVKVFVALHRDGLIYKDKRLVNWDPQLLTAISDLEVQQIEVKGSLWYLRYPLEGKTFNPDDPSTFIVVATTRPETMLGDTAVAVHPDDERYIDLVGKRVILPLVGREIPIVADEYSDPEKGSGAVKITPAHDFNDFEVGKRHGLPKISVLDQEGRLALVGNEEYLRDLPVGSSQLAEELHGVDRFAARKKLLPGWRISVSWSGSSRTRTWCRMATAPASSSSHIWPTSGMSTPKRWRSRRSRPCAAAPRRSCRGTGKRPISSGWKTSSPGAFRVSSGGATRFRRGMGRTEKCSSPKPRKRPSVTRSAITPSRKSSPRSRAARWRSTRPSA